GTAASYNPQKGYDPAPDGFGTSFRTTPDAPRRSCLAHEGPEVSKPSGRTLSAFVHVAPTNAEAARATPARPRPHGRISLSVPFRPASRACSQQRQVGGSVAGRPHQPRCPQGESAHGVGSETRKGRAPAGARARSSARWDRRVGARSAAPITRSPRATHRVH